MAGDKDGWLQALWVPMVGIGMAVVLWVSDRLLVSGAPTCNRSLLSSSCSSMNTSRHHSTPDPDTGPSVEFVRSSLHQSHAAFVSSKTSLGGERIETNEPC
jgi:hypothetical protein